MSTLTSGDYARFKRILNRARHPTLVGREQYARHAANGGAFVFTVDGEDVAVALINVPTCMLAVLSVAVQHQGRGIGSWCVRFLRPNWVRATEATVPVFERLGYQCVGRWKVGRRLRSRTMVRADIKSLGSRMRLLHGLGTPAKPAR